VLIGRVWAGKQPGLCPFQDFRTIVFNSLLISTIASGIKGKKKEKGGSKSPLPTK
jgi:hypothetical protein